MYSRVKLKLQNLGYSPTINGIKAFIQDEVEKDTFTLELAGAKLGMADSGLSYWMKKFGIKNPFKHNVGKNGTKTNPMSKELRDKLIAKGYDDEDCNIAMRRFIEENWNPQEGDVGLAKYLGVAGSTIHYWKRKLGIEKSIPGPIMNMSVRKGLIALGYDGDNCVESMRKFLYDYIVVKKYTILATAHALQVSSSTIKYLRHCRN